jgi:SAM-dependent methyltransferase
MIPANAIDYRGEIMALFSLSVSAPTKPVRTTSRMTALSASLGPKFRQRRSGPLRDLITRVYREKGAVSILDVGGLETYWDIFPAEFLRENRVSIVLLNLEPDIRPVRKPDIFSTSVGDGCALRFRDGSFDICHSNSVIEHVGDWGKKTSFAHEVSRVARYYFIQTPNFWFPWEPHFGTPFFHWLPEPVQLWLSFRRSLGWHKRATTIDDAMEVVEYASLLTRPMVAHLFRDSRIIGEKLGGITKSFVAIRDDLQGSERRGAAH